MKHVILILREISYFLACSIIFLTCVNIVASAWLSREECPYCISESRAKVLEAQNPKTIDVQRLLYRKYAHRDREMRIARQLALAGEVGDRAAQMQVLEGIRTELHCTTPELQMELENSHVVATQQFEPCNSFNSRVISGWLRYLHTTSYSSEAESQITGCLRNFRVPRYSWLSDMELSSKVLTGERSTFGKAGLSYKLENQFFAGGWTILVVRSGDSEKTHFFYSEDPLRHPPAAVWKEGLTPTNPSQLRGWLKKQTSAIPPELAECWVLAATSNEL